MGVDSRYGLSMISATMAVMFFGLPVFTVYCVLLLIHFIFFFFIHYTFEITGTVILYF